MSREQGLQRNRYELKYIIDEQRARDIREFARCHLVPDHYAHPRTYSYHIHSLYVDGPGLGLCRATVQGHKNRFKLRIRFYDDNPRHPVFFEIKRRVQDVILKERAAVKRDRVPRLLSTYWPETSDLLHPEDGEDMSSLMRFCELCHSIRGQGRIYVSYYREAWVSPADDSVRLTIDRSLCTAPYRGSISLEGFDQWRHPPLEGAVLELKFTDRYPNWMHDLVQGLNLWRGSMAKYVQCTLNREREDLYVWDSGGLGHLRP